MALVNQGGALRLVGGALGTGQACCCNKCSGPCPNGVEECAPGCGCKDSQCVPCSGPCDENNPCPEGCSCVDGQCVEGYCCINGRASGSFTTKEACEANGGRWINSVAATCTGTCGPGNRCGDGCECVGQYGPMPDDPYANGNCEQCCGPYTCGHLYFPCNEPQFQDALSNWQAGGPDPCDVFFGAGWVYQGYCVCAGPPYEAECCSDCRTLPEYEQYSVNAFCELNPFP